jgi:hypothetical protein
MSDEALPGQPPASPQDPVAPMVSIGVELHEMFLALCASGFTKREALFLVGQAVAAGVMLPTDDWGIDDYEDMDLDDNDDGDTLP